MFQSLSDYDWNSDYDWKINNNNIGELFFLLLRVSVCESTNRDAIHLILFIYFIFACSQCNSNPIKSQLDVTERLVKHTRKRAHTNESNVNGFCVAKLSTQ